MCPTRKAIVSGGCGASSCMMWCPFACHLYPLPPKLDLMVRDTHVQYTATNFHPSQTYKDTSPMGWCLSLRPHGAWIHRPMAGFDWPRIAINDRCVHVLGKHCTPFPFPCRFLPKHGPLDSHRATSVPRRVVAVFLTVSPTTAFRRRDGVSVDKLFMCQSRSPHLCRMRASTPHVYHAVL